MNQDKDYQIAVIEWSVDDTISAVIRDELNRLGHYSILVQPDTQDFREFDVVFSFGPYGNFLAIPSFLASLPVERRPIFVHWNTEGLPDLRIPWQLMRLIGAFRSWTGRLENSSIYLGHIMANIPPVSWLNARMYRFRYYGDYYYAQRNGWIDVFADSSVIYGGLHSRHGLPTIFAPWGATPRWYADLDLERDIDVLWMGNRKGKRRNNLLNQVCWELRALGLKVYVADGVENPFIHNEERTEILNRAKITLNLTRTWYDDNFSRFSMAAPNRSLIVSEPLLPHCPLYEAGIHYVSAPIEKLTEVILYYLQNENERLRIVDQAYQLVTTKLAFRNSVKQIMDAVDKIWLTRSVAACRQDETRYSPMFSHCTALNEGEQQ